MKRRVMNNTLIEITEEILASCNWKVPRGCDSVDVFLVGAGASGSRAGGGGGYTSVFYNIPVSLGQTIPITVGEGGKWIYNASREGYFVGQDGGYSEFMNSNYRAEGGKKPKGSYYEENGGDGGSGGGAWGFDGVTPGIGGSDGGNGTTYKSNRQGGIGQGKTTRCPFNGILYAGGGGGGGHGAVTSAKGGEGGGGDTGCDGKPNTGGGGGGYYDETSYGNKKLPGNGGSGIAILHYMKYK